MSTADPPLRSEADIVLLDIEGTTTPVSFVFETLFPYARENVAAFLHEHGGREDVRADLRRLWEEHAADSRARQNPPQWTTAPPAADVAEVERYVHWLMDQDRKSTGLKALQGKIWVAGYDEGTLRGALYDDVAPAFDRWRAAGKEIAIYSSGSVLAQKLLFRHSTAGDLTDRIRDYFDTTTGPKKAATSYAAIAESLGCAPGRLVFVSDVLAELEAARTAGLQTILSIRPGNAPVGDSDFPVITSFDALELV